MNKSLIGMVATLAPASVLAATITIMWTPIDQREDGTPLDPESLTYIVEYQKDDEEVIRVETADNMIEVPNVETGAYTVTVRSRDADGLVSDASFPKVALITDKEVKPAVPGLRIIIDCPEPCPFEIVQ